MSDTPKTDAEVFEVDVVFVSYDGPAFEPKNVVEPDFARQLERDNAELQKENAALKEAFAKAELLSDPAVAEGHYEYVEVWGFFRPNEIAVVIDRAAFNAARAKEAKP